ncbi:hypothetical protein ACFX13_000237 [Malus domestica]
MLEPHGNVLHVCAGKFDRARDRSEVIAGWESIQFVGRREIREIFMPALSSIVTEGKIVSWVKSEGDVLSKGESIVVFESDKADIDAETFYDGILTAIVVGEARPPRVSWRLLGFVDVSRGPRCSLEQLGMAVLASKPFWKLVDVSQWVSGFGLRDWIS